MTIAGVKRILVLAEDLALMQIAYQNRQGNEPVDYVTGTTTLLDWTPEGDVAVLDVTRAAWSSYILSLKASETRGLNERCHVSPPSLADAAHMATLVAVSTPHDCVYGSGECYWELSEVSFDLPTGRLTLRPMMGS